MPPYFCSFLWHLLFNVPTGYIQSWFTLYACTFVFKVLTLYNAKSYCFSEPATPCYVYCKPYLLYGADVINWTQSELASKIKWAFNSAICKIYKVKPQQLDDIYNYTCQLDIVNVYNNTHT